MINLKEQADSIRQFADMIENMKVYGSKLSKPVADYYRLIADQAEKAKTVDDLKATIKMFGQMEHFNNEWLHKLKEWQKQDES